mmetsp:Transcript_48817/g.136654  ORF Transcript_48817/g.136654 Transcript_48817/m.136654 type:complete len:297 (+) Transcript_48817:1381-2271(+)
MHPRRLAGALVALPVPGRSGSRSLACFRSASANSAAARLEYGLPSQGRPRWPGLQPRRRPGAPAALSALDRSGIRPLAYARASSNSPAARLALVLRSQCLPRWRQLRTRRLLPGALAEPPLHHFFGTRHLLALAGVASASSPAAFVAPPTIAAHTPGLPGGTSAAPAQGVDVCHANAGWPGEWKQMSLEKTPLRHRIPHRRCWRPPQPQHSALPQSLPLAPIHRQQWRLDPTRAPLAAVEPPKNWRRIDPCRMGQTTAAGIRQMATKEAPRARVRRPTGVLASRAKPSAPEANAAE